jgi:hypothetical protein
MPPRYAYWTILIDNKPTAFRARDREELLPTLTQLRRTNVDVVMKWFARGRIWDSPEAERQAQRRPPVTGEKRNHDWRPGGAHKDPRDRFKKKNRPERAWSDKNASAHRDRDKLGPPRDPPRGDRPTSPRPSDRPWSNKPPGDALRDKRSWSGKPPAGPPRGDRPWSSKPPAGAPRSDRPWSSKPPGGGAPRGSRPWGTKPGGPPHGDRPWQNKARDSRPFSPGGARPPHKRRDDEPDQK